MMSVISLVGHYIIRVLVTMNLLYFPTVVVLLTFVGYTVTQYNSRFSFDVEGNKVEIFLLFTNLTIKIFTFNQIPFYVIASGRLCTAMYRLL